jgi:hypothetical protein
VPLLDLTGPVSRLTAGNTAAVRALDTYQRHPNTYGTPRRPPVTLRDHTDGRGQARG